MTIRMIPVSRDISNRNENDSYLGLPGACAGISGAGLAGGLASSGFHGWSSASKLDSASRSNLYVKSSSFASPDMSSQVAMLDRCALRSGARRRIISEHKKVLLAAPRGDFGVWNKLPPIVRCGRDFVGEEGSDVELHGSGVGGDIYATNVFTCGSVWACPECNHKIMARRRQEVARVMDWARSEGLKAVMLTLTIPHYRADSCSSLMGTLAQALKSFRGGSVYKNWRDSMGCAGSARALEVTYGVNGFHVHTHELFFVRRDVDAGDFRAFALDRWEKACGRVGLIASGSSPLDRFRRFSVDVIDDMSSSEYLAKSDNSKNLHWGGEMELTGGVLKKGGSGLHPFQLLRKGVDGCDRSWELYLEYCAAFKGRAAVFFSRGLLARVDEAAPLEDVSEVDCSPSVLAVISRSDWKIVCEHDAMGIVKIHALNAGQPGVDHWLRGKKAIADARRLYLLAKSKRNVAAGAFA